MWFWVIVVVVAVPLVYVRLAPTDARKVHQPVKGAEDQNGDGHCVRIVDAGPEGLARADAAMQALARTQTIAGSVQEGRITYETRSKWIGFPDHTTIEQTDGQLRMFARLRFGRSDFGVNRARLDKIARAVAA
jgi:hypothetical protein